MDPALQSLSDRLDQLSDEFRELREGVQKAIRIAGDDPEMALIRARKVLEYVVRDVFERRVHEPPGTRPLEGLIQRIVKDGHFPPRLAAYTETIRELGNVGAHRFDQKITASDVYRSLDQLMPVLEWYLDEEHPCSTGEGPTPWRDTDRIAPARSTPHRPDPTALSVVPKGLRSFDSADSKFFLQLLPGARDDNGLPESLRFWKHRIEATDELGFTVGVIYGPSGCGKSSLIKAGLLPRLGARVITVYVEATPDQTEASLATKLRRRLPGLPGDSGLVASLTAIRRGRAANGDQKVLIIVDQFEQWLHARRGERNTELVQALRQCDGEYLQCVVLVRDDFWLALSRFLGELDIRLLVGENAALTDLFDPIHARSVLAMFGRAYGRLPEHATELTAPQNAFLDQAVAELAEDGTVIPVRLALFAEMVKGKPWTPATMKEVGGTQGVGVTFLDETFSAPTAPPEHRLHQKAVQAILKALLPETGSDIKGQMRSEADLRATSGYSSRPLDFDALIRILDPELRLITPTDPEGSTSEGQATQPRGERYYQLTHDYLVRSLREWLTHKQRENRRGRAELRLAERSSLWNVRPESRHLPSVWEWANIRLFTRSKDWTGPQRRMMAKAGRMHGVRTLGAAAVVLLLAWVGIEGYGSLRASAVVDSIASATTSDVPRLVHQLESYRRWANPRLVRLVRESRPETRECLHASLALLPVDPGQVDYLYDRLLKADPPDLPVIRDSLQGAHEKLVGRLRGVQKDPAADPRQRFSAACALASYDRAGSLAMGDGACRFITDRLLASTLKNPSHYTPLIEMLRPVRERLLAPLSATFRDKDRAESERSLAANILADYAGDQPGVLADLLMDADEKPFAVLFDRLKLHPRRAVTLLEAELVKKPAPQAAVDGQGQFAQRQGRAAVALVRLGQAGRVWPLLRHSPDPSVRSFIVNGLEPLGVDLRTLSTKLSDLSTATAAEEAPAGDRSRMDAILFDPDCSTRRALYLALGQYKVDAVSPGERELLVAKLLDAYRDDPDPGIHGAAEWTLRHWDQGEKLKAAALPEFADRGDRRWYVNSAGQTMALIEGPVVFSMGSPVSEPERFDNETPHRKRINRRFAIATKEVTVEQYQRFLEENPKAFQLSVDRYSPELSGPRNGTDWYDAAAYCNWLSREEGLEECYAPNPNGAYAEGMKCLDGFLNRSGYRLPTEAEWEYACRAGTVTARYCGRSVALLERYAWSLQNSRERAWPCGLLQPNDLGLFDMLGNVCEWCQDQYSSYPAGGNEPIEDDIKTFTDLKDKDSRLLRGASFSEVAGDFRAAYRYFFVPSLRSTNLGFRPARTCP